MILIFTGNGKGKTTAALGQAIRSLGDGKRVLIIQFIKGPWKSGEDSFAEKFQVPISSLQIVKGGLGFVGILGDKIPFENHQKSAKETWELAKKEILSDDWDLVILDEINNALHLRLLDVDKVVDFFKKFRIDSAFVPQDSVFCDIVLTGRDANQSLIELADLVTEMKEIKHPYQEGEEAKKGIEY